jgi:hypothetical protein
MVRWATVLVAAALLLPACDGGKGGGGGGGGPPLPGGELDAEAPFLRTFPASTGGGPADPIRTVVRDPAAWAELWAKANAHVTPVPKAPAVDFSKEMVAFAGLGPKPTTGYSVEIVGVSKESGKLVLLLIEREPLKSLPVAAAATSPWHAVVLAKSDLAVEWQKYEPRFAK